jgi:glycine/D-amino acid oxidase-like deaminating enzyme
MHELHAKVTFRDVLRALPRSAPFLIWSDPVVLDWPPEERMILAQSSNSAHLLERMPGGVHIRPVDGPAGDEVWLIWTYENHPRMPVWPPAYSDTYASAVMRAIGDMVPAMKGYGSDAMRGVVDGGYYCKTPENRPLIGPLAMEGAFVCGALSGYGVMAAHGAAELVAAHVTGGTLPDWSKWFLPSRYESPEYQRMVNEWGALVGQL